MWKPDQEEQRYCWACANWFNTSCLKKHAQTQSSVAAEQKALNCYEGHAEIIVKVAFQPTARGGPRHFASGNGRIVRHAREILNVLDPDSHPPYVAHLLEAGGVPTFNREEAWTEFMEETIGLKIAHRGDTNYEQLILQDQQMYSCPRCQNMAL